MAEHPTSSSPNSSNRPASNAHSTHFPNTGNPTLTITSLKHPNLHLRLPTPSDAPALLHLFSNPLNIQYDKSCANLNNPAAISALIHQWRDIHPPLTRANIVVTLSNQVIGTGGLGWIRHRKADDALIGSAGVMLDPAFRGKGYAYEALSMVVDHGFCVLGLEEVRCSCVDENEAFRGLMRRFGWKAERIEGDLWGNTWLWKVSKEGWFGGLEVGGGLVDGVREGMGGRMAG